MSTSRSRSIPAPVQQGLLIVLGLIVVMWLSESIDALDDHRLDQYGIEPRSTDGLVGVLAAPLLHAGFGHLESNTIPFAVLGAVIALSGAVRLVAVTAIVWVVGGLGTWLVAPSDTIHIGASGIVFGYAAYLVARGVFDRAVRHIVVAALVVAVWGGALAGGLLPQEGISWQGHLFGALAGVLAAYLLGERRRTAAAV